MIKAKKSLGQNFLIDQNIIEVITNITKVENKNILEVGPGTGNLTTAIYIIYCINDSNKDIKKFFLGKNI